MVQSYKFYYYLPNLYSTFLLRCMHFYLLVHESRIEYSIIKKGLAQKLSQPNVQYY